MFGRIVLPFSALLLVAIAVFWRADFRRGASDAPTDRDRLTSGPNQEVSPQPALAQIRGVLPSITATPSDWSQFKPASITVAPYPGLELAFNAVRITEENGITTWIGRNGLPGASLVGIGKRDSWYGLLTCIAGNFAIEVRKSSIHVFPQRDSTDCASLLNSRLWQASAPVQESVRATASDEVLAESSGTIYNIDVALFYTAQLELWSIALNGQHFDADGVDHPLVNSVAELPDYLDSKYRSFLETSNVILEQSGVRNFRWNLKGIYKSPDYSATLYDYNGDNGSARYDIAQDANAFQFPSTLLGAYVVSKAKEVSADQMGLLIPNNRQAGGIAETPGHYFVIGIEAAVTTVTHEMAHNFGIHHDRESDGIPITDVRYNFGYLFHYDTTRYGGGDSNVTVGDVMSYARKVLPYFSNPHVLVRGTDFGTAVGAKAADEALYSLGVDVGQPRPAYAARSLSEGAITMATYRIPLGMVFPSIISQPVSAAVAALHGAIRLSTTAVGTNLTYQWRRNGLILPGMTDSTLLISDAQSQNAGTYDVVVGNTLGAVISGATTVSITTDPITAKLINISTRSSVGAGDNVQIAGFVISGAPKTVLIRAVGPTLGGFGVTGVLADPVLELRDATSVMASNDDWSIDPTAAAAIRAAIPKVGAFDWPIGSKDAGILTTLNPGRYTAVVSGKNGTTGVALIEMYEVTDNGSNVVNISTRSPVGTGDAVQIAGFVIGANGPKTVLIRASGPALAAIGLSGALADPVLELHDEKATVAINDDWSADPASAEFIRSAAATVGAFDWATGSKDAAILITLAPGRYTAVVSGKNGASGVGLIEVYDVSR